jgi:mycofactocin glycosyltransferase
VLPLPADFGVRLDPATRVDGRVLYGGEPYMHLSLTARQAAALQRWRAGAPVGDDGALARALVEHNLAQPVPPAFAAPVSLVIVHGVSPAAARNAGLAAAEHDLVACLDADVTPRAGWLEALVPHFADPEVQLVGARVAAAPADRGPLPARVRPRGRVSFVPGAALVARRGVRFDETLPGGEDVELSGRVHTRYEPAAVVDHPPIPLRRRVAYGRYAAALGGPVAIDVSPWSAAAWAALALKRPQAALAIAATATALLDDPQRLRIAGLGTLQAGRAIAAALTTAYWPLAPLAPRAYAAAALVRAPHLAEDLAYGAGLWLGCLQRRDLRALKPRLGWTINRLTADALIVRSSIKLP